MQLTSTAVVIVAALQKDKDVDITSLNVLYHTRKVCALRMLLGRHEQYATTGRKKGAALAGTPFFYFCSPQRQQQKHEQRQGQSPCHSCVYSRSLEAYGLHRVLR